VQEYNFQIEYRPGTKMRHVDALSRNVVNVRTISISEDGWIQRGQDTDPKIVNIKEEFTKLRTDYVLKRNILYRKTDQGKRWVVPKGMWYQVVQSYHDDYAHPGAEKTIELLQQFYWFPYMRKYVKNFVRRCLPCLYNKSTTGTTREPMQPIQKIPEPFDILHIDHLGPFVTTHRKTRI